MDVDPRLDYLVGDEAVEYYRSVARTRDSGKSGTLGNNVRGIGSGASATHTSFYLTQTCVHENYAPPPAFSIDPQASERAYKQTRPRPDSDARFEWHLSVKMHYLSLPYVNPRAVDARGLSAHTHWLNKNVTPTVRAMPRQHAVLAGPWCVRDNDEDETVNSEGEHEASHERFVYAHNRGGERTSSSSMIPGRS